MLGPGLVFLVWAASTVLFGFVVAWPLLKASSRQSPIQPTGQLSPEERAAWDQIERHWQ